jgi:hypothetical protein
VHMEHYQAKIKRYSKSIGLNGEKEV